MQHRVRNRRKALAWAALALAAPLCAAHAQPLEGCPSGQLRERFDNYARTGKMPPTLGQWLSDPKAQYVAPYRAFDNVHFVGVCWVSAWLIRTNDGYVLIDTLHEPFVDQLIENIRAVGVDLNAIKYVLMTHGHFDHAGGATKLKPLLAQARFAMTQRGWDEALASARASESTPRPWRIIAPDMVVKDGDVIALGDQRIRIYETPGHTWGTASFSYDVKDGDKTYRALTIGGLGLNAIESSAQVEAYLVSVERIERLLGSAQDPVALHLTTHPFFTGLPEAKDRLASRKPGEPHPLVDTEGFRRQLQALSDSAQQRLAVERKAGR